ncbi:MAG: ribonuclease E/G [Thiohalocapsa sp.]
MRGELLIAAGPGEWRTLWLEDGAAAELHVERGDIRPAGSTHLGRVIRRLPGLDAVLVDIGEERPGFLPGRTALDEGARIVVEVRHEATQDKGARLSAHPADVAAALTPPAQLTARAGFAAALALRLSAEPERVLADDVAILPELRAAFPAAECACVAAADWPVDIEAAFDAALSPSLTLAGGGRLHIAEGGAAVLIDVDTGSADDVSLERSAMSVNLAAAAAIARHLRLRQLAGGIIIDFAALDGRRRRERVAAAMTEALASDPARPQVLGWSRLGHLEIVRPRRLRPLSAAMLESAGPRKNAAALAYEALRLLHREARARPAANWTLLVAPALMMVLQGPAASALHGLETRLGRAIRVEIMAEPGPAPFDIRAA